MTMKPIETHYKGYRFRSRLEARWAVFFDTLGVDWEYEKEGYDLGPAGLYLPDFWLPGQQCWVEVKGKEPTEEEDGKALALAQASGLPVYTFGALDHPKARGGSGPAWAWLPVQMAWFPDERRMDEGRRFSWDYGHGWTSCKWCGGVGITWAGTSTRLPCHCWFTQRAVLWADERRKVAMLAGAFDARVECTPELEKLEVEAIAAMQLSSSAEWFRKDGTIRGALWQTYIYPDWENWQHPKLAAAYRAARSARFEHGDKP